MAISEAAAAEGLKTLELTREVRPDDDRRAEVCTCGHTMAKHEQTQGVWFCLQGYGKCPCRVPTAALKVPNARVFSFRTDDRGHALVKGIGRTIEMRLGHRLDWVTRCVDCDSEPVTVVAADEGKRNEPRCEVHR